MGLGDVHPAHAFGEGPVLLYITSSLRGKGEAMPKWSPTEKATANSELAPSG